MRSSLEELKKKMDDPATSEAERAKLRAKAEKIIAMLEQTM